MARNRKSVLQYVLLGLLLLSAVGIYVLVTPDNPATALLRGNISDVRGGRVITGPYPIKSDFRELHDHGVKVIVSLLDPKVPYENILLNREKELAHQFGMKVVDFPMTSILGVHAGQ